MAKYRKRQGKRRCGSRPKQIVFSVSEPQAAEYAFALIRSLMTITRDYNNLQLTTYFLEMAALEIAPRLEPEALQRNAQQSRRATS